MALKTHSKAPSFILPSTSGKDFHLDDLAGKPCILYFYPKDFTSVCTREACAFRDQFADFRNLSVPVLGISRDDLDTHLKFKKQHALPFELLADVDGEVVKSYDALMPIIGIPKRITYLLDCDHRIAALHDSLLGHVGHVDEMLNSLNSGT